MKKRFWLWRRNGVYYLQDAETRQKESLHTRDRREAERLRNARNDAATRPVLGMALAKAYLSAHDAEISKRTWQNVMDYFCARGKPQTQERRQRAARSKCFDRLRSLKLLETNSNDFLTVLESSPQTTLRNSCSFAASNIVPRPDHEMQIRLLRPSPVSRRTTRAT
jgi:hypothetical protein